MLLEALHPLMRLRRGHPSFNRVWEIDGAFGFSQDVQVIRIGALNHCTGKLAPVGEFYILATSTSHDKAEPGE